MQFSPQGGNVTVFAPSDAVGLDLPCAAGHLGLQSAPSALLRALGFEPQSVIIRINSITRKG